MPDYDPEAELNGRYVAGFVESAGEVSPLFERKLRDIFDEHVSGVDADSWYRIGDLEDAFREILAETGEETMVEGGIEAARRLPFPDDVETLCDAVGRLNELHTNAHRNSNLEYPAGRFTIDFRSETSLRGGITTGYPYTAPIIEGVYTGTIQRFTDSVPVSESVESHSAEADAWLFTWDH